MSPLWIIGAGVLQLVILYAVAPWPAGLGSGAGALLILGMFAVTRLRWDSHLDMILAMTGPGGLGMLLPMLILTGPACHSQKTASGWVLMAGGMLLLAVPLCWTSARCLIEARREGYGVMAITVDLAGMQAGMMLGHLPMIRWPMDDPRLVWIHHAVMLASMLLGMLAGMFVLRWYVNRAARVSKRSSANTNNALFSGGVGHDHHASVHLRVRLRAHRHRRASAGEALDSRRAAEEAWAYRLDK